MANQQKGVLIGIFTDKDKVSETLKRLSDDFSIEKDKVFIFSIDTNSKEYLMTFKTYDREKYLKSIKGSTVLHVKNSCIFSINALNRLIDEENGYEGTDNSSYQVDWSKYHSKLIMLTRGKLSISNIEKIVSKDI